MANVYSERRSRIVTLVILGAHDVTQQVDDTAHPFVQESNFYWLTGIREPGWKLIIDGVRRQSHLVKPNISKQAALFEGDIDLEAIKRVSGIDHIIDEIEFSQLIDTLVGEYTSAYCFKASRGDQISLNQGPKNTWRTVQEKFDSVQDIRTLLGSKRARKSQAERTHMRQAASITIDAFSQTQEIVSTVKYEYNLEAQLTYAFRNAGAQGHAYEPIVASGKNALTLHYTKNNDKLPENGLVLIDAGARVNGYCADVTRTYAVGTPTDRQKAVHAAVEKAHHEIIALLGPEKSVKEYHEEVDTIMIEALKSLGLYKKPEDYRTYFPHAISHGLGIDVHDSLGNPTHFKPGMVLTVEPGIYIPEEEIGVRIEDDILITKDGIENLTGDLPTSL